MELTQTQLGKLAGVSQATISDHENDVAKKPRADELMRIAAALGTTPEYLISGTGPENLRDASSDESDLLAAFAKLTPSGRAALVAAAKAMALTPKR